MTFYPLEKLHKLCDGYRKPFRVGGRYLLLMEERGTRYLFENRCPHAGGPLHLATVENDNLRCPWHGICFNLQNGHAIDLESSVPAMKLVFFKLVYRDNVVGVDL